VLINYRSCFLSKEEEVTGAGQGSVMTSVVKTRKLKWASHVLCMRETRISRIILVGRREEKYLFGDIDVD
jgi:uncharacterized Rossmann fold enzyme